MNIIVLMKHVVDTSSIKIDTNTKQPILRGVLTKISDYDKNAIEEAVRIKEKLGAKVTLLSISPSEAATTTLKDAIAMGADEAFLISTGTTYLFDGYLIAKSITNAIKKFFGNNYDIILAGESSEDLNQGYVPAAVAVMLGLPFISSVTKIELLNNKIRAERRMEEYIEVLECSIPAVISVTREINKPRIPTTLQMMRVPLSKIKTITLQDIGISEEIAITYLEKLEAEEVTKRKNIKLEGTPDEIAIKLLEVLKKEGVLE
jgi:electron transfer flavoprotein beta subunit